MLAPDKRLREEIVLTEYPKILKVNVTTKVPSRGTEPPPPPVGIGKNTVGKYVFRGILEC